MKRCIKCGETNEYTQFFKDKSRKDGYCNACKTCRGEYYKEYLKTPNKRYTTHCHNCKNRGLLNDIEYDRYKAITSQPCAYCGTTESPRGLDRVYNDFPYTIDNVVSCCWGCNRSKHSLDFNQFWALCDAVSNKRKERSSQQS